MDGYREKYINVVDLIVISYLFDTLILSFFIREPHGWVHPVMFRLLSFFTIGVIVYHDKKYPSRTSGILHFFYPLVLLSYIYGETAQLNHIFFTQALDSFLIAADNSIFGCLHPMEFSKIMPQGWFAELMNFSYFSYYLFTLGIPLAAYIYRKEKAMEILFVIVASFLFYYVFFIVFPTWGPQFYLEKTPTETGGFFSGLIHFIQEKGEAPTGAFPSSHVGMMLVYCWIAAKYFRRILPLTIVMTILISAATVYIKAHYAVDIIAGYVSAPAVIFLSKRYLKLSIRLLSD